MEEKFNSIESIFRSNREKFLDSWKSRVDRILNHTPTPAPEAQGHILSEPEFKNLYDAYIDFMIKEDSSGSNRFVEQLIREKINEGFMLSTLELVNASFMQTARELFRETYPDAFDTRMEYLEKLSQMILNNEVTIAQYYENYLKDLNNRLTRHAAQLEQHNASLVEFIDIATNQLQTPLWSILGFVSKLQRKYYKNLDEQGRHCLNRITANVSDMHQLIEDVTAMLFMTKENMVEKELFLGDLIRQAVNRVCSEIDKEFRCHIAEELRINITGDPGLLKTLFYQLLKNCAQYTQAGKQGEAFLSWQWDTRFHLYIEDNGIGIAERFRELVFKPMERLKEVDTPGSGMGLTFVRRIVRGHGGEVRIESSEKYSGTRIHMDFPLDIVNAF